MTPAQQVHYRRDLWPKACRAQGWHLLSDAAREAKRREVTLKVSNGRTDSTSKINNVGECTALFRYLEALINKTSLYAARAVANPEHEAAADACRRTLYVIDGICRKAGFADAYIREIAAWDCREAQVSDWRRLPLESLKRVLIHLNQRKNDKDPDVRQTGPRRRKAKSEKVVYQMRPRTTFQPKPKPVLVPTEARDENPF